MKFLAVLLAVLAFSARVSAQTVDARPQELTIIADSICGGPNGRPPAIRTRSAQETLLRDRQCKQLDAIAARPLIPPPVPQPPADTTCVSITMTPSSGPSILVGGTQQFVAVTKDAQGAVRRCGVVWRSGNPPVASVSAGGLATGLSPGLSDVYATSGALSTVVRLEVRAPDPVPPDPSPIPPTTCTRTFANQTVGDIVVAPGERVCIGANVQARNVLVPAGVLVMRAGSSLKHLGGNPDSYVGGGLHYAPEYANDIGTWVWGDGALDISCTAKTAWNYTGADPSWLPGDELWIAPTALGRTMADYKAVRWTPGSPVPRIDPRVPAAEVINGTRDCSITGPGHIHINSRKPQRIEYVALINMGVTRSNGLQNFGRYALHLHMQGDASRGTVVRGVVCVNALGTCFVPHTSHGTTWIDNASINSYGPCFWWDMAHPTNDLKIDRLACAGVYNPNVIGDARGVLLGTGHNVEIRNSAVSGVLGMSGPAVGYDWPEPVGVPDSLLAFMHWKFIDNVGHNNRVCLRFWDNIQAAHIQERTTCYRNSGGSDQGAYISANQYIDFLSVQDGYLFSNDMSSTRAALYWNASSVPGINAPSGALCRLCTLEPLEGPPLEVGHRQIPGDSLTPVRYEDMRVVAPAGKPKVLVGDGVYPWYARFVRSQLSPSEIQILPFAGNEGTRIEIDNDGDGRYEVTVRFLNGVKVVSP